MEEMSTILTKKKKVLKNLRKVPNMKFHKNLSDESLSDLLETTDRQKRQRNKRTDMQNY